MIPSTPDLSPGVIRGLAQKEYLQIAAKVLEATSSAVMVTNSHGEIVVVNQSFERITGYSRAEIVGQNPIVLCSNDTPNDFYSSVWRDIVSHGRWAGRVTGVRKNGESYPQHLTISAIFDEDGDVEYYLRMFTDITEQVEREREIEYLAHHDQLTGLLNRVLFVDRLTHAMAYCRRNNAKAAVLFLDLDKFKSINARFHQLGRNPKQRIDK